MVDSASKQIQSEESFKQQTRMTKWLERDSKMSKN